MLIAIAPADAVDVVWLADAVVTVPIPARVESGAMRHMVFDLLACLVVDVIGRDLCRRLNHKAMSRSIWRMESRRRPGRKPDLAPRGGLQSHRSLASRTVTRPPIGGYRPPTNPKELACPHPQTTTWWAGGLWADRRSGSWSCSSPSLWRC